MQVKLKMIPPALLSLRPTLNLEDEYQVLVECTGERKMMLVEVPGYNNIVFYEEEYERI